MPMNKQFLLIFDFDGTIADTFHYLIKIGNRLSKEFGFKQIKEDEIDGMKDKSVLETIKHLNIPFLMIPMIVAKAKKELHKEIDSVKPIDGLKEALQQLKSLGFKMGILTSNSMKNVVGFLKNNEIDLFDFIHATPKIWSKNRSLLGLIEEYLTEGAEPIYIGDETRDIIAAQKAGVRCAAVTWGYNSPKALQGQSPDYIVNDPQDLIRLFQ